MRAVGGRDQKDALGEGAVRRHTFNDRLGVGQGYREGRRCWRDTYPESYITHYTSIRRFEQTREREGCVMSCDYKLRFFLRRAGFDFAEVGLITPQRTRWES